MDKLVADERSTLPATLKSKIDELLQCASPRQLIAYILRDSARPATRVSLADTVRHIEMLDQLGEQYLHARVVLADFNCPSPDVPTWKVIRASLNPDILRLAGHMEEPTLLLDPPVTLEGIEALINFKNGLRWSEAGDLIQRHGIRGNVETNDGWHGWSHSYEPFVTDLHAARGRTEGATPTWKVKIVEGASSIKPNEKLQMKDGLYLRDAEQVKALVDDATQKGLGVMGSKRDYLVLTMNRLVAGKPLSGNTVLNPRSITQKVRDRKDEGDRTLFWGSWQGGRVYFGKHHDGVFSSKPSKRDNGIRVRSSIEVELTS